MAAKRLLVCVLCVVCLMAAILIAQAETPEAQSQETETVQIQYACIVRSRASFNAADIGSLEDGVAVTVLGQKGKFYKIDCYDMVGFVAMSQVAEKDGYYYIVCEPASSETETVCYTAHTEALELRHSLLALARQQEGKPYIYGSTGTRGFDCSGLTSYLYRNHGALLNRTASSQLSDGIIVSSEGLQVGDLVFFRYPGEYALASHVGIYAGDNKMIHAGNGGVECISLSNEYYANSFLCARRVINTDCSEQELPVPAAAARSAMPANGISGRRVG